MKPHDLEALTLAAVAIVRIAYFQGDPSRREPHLSRGFAMFAPGALAEAQEGFTLDLAEALTGHRDLSRAFEVVRVGGQESHEEPLSRPRKRHRPRTPPPPSKAPQRAATGLFE